MRWNSIMLIIIILYVICSIKVIKAIEEDAEELMMIVGKVDQNSARILFDYIPEGNENEIMEYEMLHESFKQPIKIKLETGPSRQPKVITLTQLEKSKVYEIKVLEAKTKKEMGRLEFKTPPYENMKIITVSCDRYEEDRDEASSFDTIGEREAYHLMVHLGDQIYVDKQFNKEKANHEDEEALARAFRRVYRTTFGRKAAQRILRRGAHIMLPDDHDIINNVDREMTQKEHEKYQFVKIGRAIYKEYQHALVSSQREEIFWVDEGNYVENTCIFFLDTRHERTFSYDEKYPLWGETQFNMIKRSLSKCSEDSVKVFFGSIPLLNMDENMANLVYWAEKERYGSHRDIFGDVNRFLRLIFDSTHDTKKILYVGGDIHQYIEHELQDQETGKSIAQISTSGITKGSTVVGELKVYLFNLITAHLASNQVGQYQFKRKQVYLSKNYGTIHLSPRNLNYSGNFLAYENSLQQLGYFIYLHFNIIKVLIIIIPLLSCFSRSVCCRRKRKKQPKPPSAKK